MEQPLDPLIEAAVKPLCGNAEQRLATIALLSENADPDHPAAAEVIARWEEMDRRKGSFLWKRLLWVAAFVSVGFAISAQLPVMRYALHYQSSGEYVFPNPFIPEGLTESQKLLIRDPSLSEVDQAEALHLSAPDNPAYFAEYAAIHLIDFDKLPENFLETAARVDPENSYFLYLAVSAVGGDLTEQGLELLARASKLPRFETYSTRMVAERLRAVGPTETVIQRINFLNIAFNRRSELDPLREMEDIMPGRAMVLSTAQDTEGFLELVEQSDHLLQGLATNPDTMLMNESVGLLIQSRVSELIYYDAEQLGLMEVGARYRKISDEFEVAENEEWLRYKNRTDDLIQDRGATLASTSLAYERYAVRTPPPISPADVAPGRYAEHDFIMHIGLSAIPLAIFILLLPVFLYRFIFPKPLRRTAARFAQLVRASDLVLAFLFGVLLPAAAILFLNRFTELGGREWSLRKFVLFFPSVHLAIILLWVLLAPAVILRWRLLRRIAPFGLKCIPGYLSLLALLAISILAFAAYPIALKFGLGDRPLTALTAPLALWGAVVFFSALLGIIGKAPQRISLAATSLAILPVYLAAIIVTPVLLPIYKSSEIHWLAKDTLINPNTNAPDLGLYEFRLAAQKRKETREILGMDH